MNTIRMYNSSYGNHHFLNNTLSDAQRVHLWTLFDDMPIDSYLGKIDYKKIQAKLRYNTSYFTITHINSALTKEDTMSLVMDYDFVQEIKNNIFNFKNQEYLISLPENLSLIEFFNAVSEKDKTMADELLLVYQHFMAKHSSEVALLTDNLIMQQRVMMQYLTSHHIEETFFPFTENENFDEWFKKADDAQNNFRAFNDLDYTPFMMNGKYVIKDVSSDSVYLFVPSDALGNGAWYEVDKRLVFDQVRHMYPALDQDLLHEAAYESCLDLHIMTTLDPSHYTLIARFENNQVSLATSEIYVVNLLQNYIFNVLNSEGLLEGVPGMSMKSRIKVTQIENAHQIDALHGFFDYVNRFRKGENGKSFNSIPYMTENTLSEFTLPEMPDIALVNSEEYKKLIGFFMPKLDKYAYRYMDTIGVQDKRDIVSYMNEYVRPYALVCPEIQAHFSLIEEKLNQMN